MRAFTDAAKLDDEAKDDFDDEEKAIEEDSVKKIPNILNDGRNKKSDGEIFFLFSLFCVNFCLIVALDPRENSSGLHSLSLPITFIFSIIIIRLASIE